MRVIIFPKLKAVPDISVLSENSTSPDTHILALTEDMLFLVKLHSLILRRVMAGRL